MNSQWEQSEPNGIAHDPQVATAVAESEPVHAAPAVSQPAPPVAPAAPALAATVETKPATADDAGHIDKIRDILFGSHMRDYDGRFSRLEQALLKESAELRETTRSKIESLESYVKQELEALHVRFKAERDERTGSVSAVARDLQELHLGLTKRIAEVDDQGATAHHDLREQLLEHRRSVAEEIAAKERQIGALLEQRFHELRKGKTDRSALASLFNEVALRLNNEFHLPGSDH